MGFTGAHCEATLEVNAPKQKSIISNSRIATGKSCSKKCQNFGLCKINKTTKLDECQCQRGFSGELCENKIPCGDNPCGNNGLCMTSGAQYYTCICFSGYTGMNCRVKINE